MKFIKGVYLFTPDEIERLIESQKNGEFAEYNGKKYIPLYCQKKSNDLLDVEKFKSAILKHKKKKDICNELGTSYFKLVKFMRTNFNSEDLTEVRVKINI